MEEPIGIKRIAKLANVSIGTVDRVLHDRSGVSKATLKNVQKIIRETGYVKNTTASRFKLAATKKIRFGILIPEIKNERSYWNLPKKGVQKAIGELKEMGVTASFYEFKDSESFLSQSTSMCTKDYDAIITVPFFQKEGNQLLEKAESKKIPVVFLDTEIPLDGSRHFIRQNSYRAGMVAGRLLQGLSTGSTDYFVVSIVKEEGIRVNNLQRERGFRAFFQSSSNNAKIQTINHTVKGKFRITKEMETWFTTNKPKGIFVTNSKSQLVSNIVEHFKFKNVGIVGFDLNRPNILCLKQGKMNFLINQKPEHQGYAAIKGLFDFLTQQDSSGLDLDVPVEIIVKENLGTLE